MIAVVDIDGVLADPAHRERFVQARPKDWDGFFAAVGHDALIEAGRDLVAELAADHEIVLLSGRPERTRAATQAWLARQGIGYDRLLLRPDADHRPAAMFKAQTVPEIGPPSAIGVVVDDDGSVVERLGALGYRVLQFP